MPKYVIALALLAEPACALAADCSVDVDGNDAMQFDRKEIVVDAGCKDFTIRLAHSGKPVKDAWATTSSWPGPPACRPARPTA